MLNPGYGSIMSGVLPYWRLSGFYFFYFSGIFNGFFVGFNHMLGNAQSEKKALLIRKSRQL